TLLAHESDHLNNFNQLARRSHDDRPPTDVKLSWCESHTGRAWTGPSQGEIATRDSTLAIRVDRLARRSMDSQSLSSVALVVIAMATTVVEAPPAVGRRSGADDSLFSAAVASLADSSESLKKMIGSGGRADVPIRIDPRPLRVVNPAGLLPEELIVAMAN